MSDGRLPGLKKKTTSPGRSANKSFGRELAADYGAGRAALALVHLHDVQYSGWTISETLLRAYFRFGGRIILGAPRLTPGSPRPGM